MTSPATRRILTLANTCGVGLQGASVKFTASAGPNAGFTGTATTDAAGVAAFSYSSTLTSTDTIGASTVNPAGTITSNDVTVTWQKRPAQLSITGGASTSDYNDPATVAANLTDSAGPVAGQPVVFTPQRHPDLHRHHQRRRPGVLLHHPR